MLFINSKLTIVWLAVETRRNVSIYFETYENEKSVLEENDKICRHAENDELAGIWPKISKQTFQIYERLSLLLK